MDKTLVVVSSIIAVFLLLLTAVTFIAAQQAHKHQLDMLKAGASACEAILSTK